MMRLSPDEIGTLKNCVRENVVNEPDRLVEDVEDWINRLRTTKHMISDCRAGFAVQNSRALLARISLYKKCLAEMAKVLKVKEEI